MIYWKCSYENVHRIYNEHMHMRLTAIWKYIVPFLPLFLYLKCFLRLEVGTRFKALHNENNIKYHVVVEINPMMDIMITSRFCWVEIDRLLCFWLRNPTKHNRAKTITYVNHGNGETRTHRAQNILIPSGKHNHFCHTDVYVQYS